VCTSALQRVGCVGGVEVHAERGVHFAEGEDGGGDGPDAVAADEARGDGGAHHVGFGAVEALVAEADERADEHVDGEVAADVEGDGHGHGDGDELGEAPGEVVAEEADEHGGREHAVADLQAVGRERAEALHADQGHGAVHDGVGRLVDPGGVADGERGPEQPEGEGRQDAAHQAPEQLAHEHGPGGGQGQVPRLEVLHEIRCGCSDGHHHPTQRQSRQHTAVRARPGPEDEQGKLAIRRCQAPVREPHPICVAESQHRSDNVRDQHIVPLHRRENMRDDDNRDYSQGNIPRNRHPGWNPLLHENLHLPGTVPLQWIQLLCNNIIQKLTTVVAYLHSIAMTTCII
jgi:hypothetical protein